MLEKLLTIYQTRKELETDLKAKRGAFEDSIALDKATLNDLNDKEDQLREEALMLLEAGGKDSIQVKDKTISRQVKQTKRIIDPFAFMEASLAPGVLKSIGMKEDEVAIIFTRETVIEDKKMADGIIDKYEKVEGKLLDGVEVKTTKYLTIRDK